MYKFTVFSPDDEKVIFAIIAAASDAGAGVIGKYTHCAFITKGYGTWMPEPGADPEVGKVGELSKENEVRIEMECPEDKLQAVTDAIKKVHPYEKISIDAVHSKRFE
jgi:hypothetical protein